MNKIILLIGLIGMSIVGFCKNPVTDTLYIPSGADTLYSLSIGNWNFNNGGYLEVIYDCVNDSLDADDATIDVGTRSNLVLSSGTTVSSFNSYGTIGGVSLPYTLNVTSNNDSNTGTTSLMLTIDRFLGEVFLIKLTKGSVTAGKKVYIKFRQN